MIKKRCSVNGCINTIPRAQQPPYCEQHKRERYRSYDSKREPQLVAFYKSNAWKQLRASVLAEKMHLCELCYQRGELTEADTVHHIVEVKDDWSRRLERTNLQAICRACHNKVHAKGFQTS